MSDYDGAALHVEQRIGAVWAELDVASVTVVSTYDISEAGVALYSPATASVTMSWKGNEVADPLALAARVRARYGAVELFDGFVADLARTYTAHPPTIGLSASLVSVAGMFLAEPVTWKTIPAEAADVRLLRWFTSVTANGAAMPLMPPEEPGSATRLELLRAFSDAVGLPVYLDADDLPVVYTTADTVPASLSGPDAAYDLYASVAHTASAGARVLSSDDDDRAYRATGSLLADRTDVAESGFRVPQALPLPFADPLRTVRFEMSYTPKHCGGAVDFDQPTINVTRYRPPAVPYSPGGATTPLSGGQPWDPDKDYPAGSVVSKNGHLYRATGPIKKGADGPGSAEDVEPWEGDVSFNLTFLTMSGAEGSMVSGGAYPHTWILDVDSNVKFGDPSQVYAGLIVHDNNWPGIGPVVAKTISLGGRLGGTPTNAQFKGTAGPVTLAMTADTSNLSAVEFTIAAYVGASAGTALSLLDTVNGTPGRFSAWVTSSKAPNGDITVDIEVDPGQAAGMATSIGLFAQQAGPYETRLAQETFQSDDTDTKLHYTFAPTAIVWDTDGDRTGDFVIPTAFTGLVLRQGDGNVPDDTYEGPIVATYPFGSLVGAHQPVWARMI